MKKRGKKGGCKLMTLVLLALGLMAFAPRADAGIPFTVDLTLTSGTAVAVPAAGTYLPVPDYGEWAITALYVDMPTLVTATSVTFRFGAPGDTTTPTATTPFYYVSASVNSNTDTQLISPVPAATYAVPTVPLSQKVDAHTKIWAYTNSGAASGSTVSIKLYGIMSRVDK